MSSLEIKEKLTELIKNMDNDDLLQEVYQMISADAIPYSLTTDQILKVDNAKREIAQGKSATHDEVKRRTKEWLGI